MIFSRCDHWQDPGPLSDRRAVELHQNTIGHNISATVFTGGDPLRIYSDYGLTASMSQKSAFPGLPSGSAICSCWASAWPGTPGGVRDGPAGDEPPDRVRLPAGMSPFESALMGENRREPNRTAGRWYCPRRG
jgi:hypothetical protein